MISKPFTLEQSHLAASAEVVGRTTITSATYAKALLTVANPHVVFVDDFGNIRESRWVGTNPVTVLLKQPIVFAAAPSVIRISLDMSSILHFDASQQTMLRTVPSFTVTQLLPGRSGAVAAVADELEASIGKVTAVNGSTFTLTDTVSGLTTTYLTDRNTAFDGLSLRTMLSLLVAVHSANRADGQLLVQEVSVNGSGAGSIVAGIITDSSGTKAAAQEVYGAGASSSQLGTFSKVAMDPASSFEMDSRGMDLTGITLGFGPNSMVPGQRIQFLSRTTMQSSANGSANLGQTGTARLMPQTISGTASNVTVASNGSTSFDLQLPVNDGSPLSTLGEGNGLIHVLTQPLTKSSLSSITEGAHVRVRGLLLFNADPGQRQGNARMYVVAAKNVSNYYMVARTIQKDGSK